jgi:hypothetical protein
MEEGGEIWGCTTMSTFYQKKVKSKKQKRARPALLSFFTFYFLLLTFFLTSNSYQGQD